MLNIKNKTYIFSILPAEVEMIHYKGYTSGDKKNYRPISILSFFPKIMKKIIANRLTKYLNDYSLLSTSQYGFQRGLSTYMALLDLQSNISEAMNNNMFSIGVIFNISKAFDTVNHDIY